MSQAEHGVTSARQPRSPADKASGQYVYVDRPVETRHQVKFGRVSGISESDRRYLVTYFNGRPSDERDDYIDITKRIHQYYNDPKHYVISALDSGRKLTMHEQDVFRNWNDPKRVPDISIAHILGSGLVQNLLNRMILQYREGATVFRQQAAEVNSTHPLRRLSRAQEACCRAEKRLRRTRETDQTTSTAGSDARMILEDARTNVAEAARPVVRALAMQATAIARMRGIGRAIIAEEPVAHGYGEKLPTTATQIDKRHLMARDVDIALGNGALSDRDMGRDSMSAAASSPAGGSRSRSSSTVTRNPERQQAYLSYLMHTVDSSGNLRLGSRLGNSAVGAGFDMPLNERGQPTARGLRLYEALRAFGLPDMEECRTLEACGDTYHTGHFTTDTGGRRLSSSTEVSDRLNDEAVEQLMHLGLRSHL